MKRKQQKLKVVSANKPDSELAIKALLPLIVEMINRKRKLLE